MNFQKESILNSSKGSIKQGIQARTFMPNNLNASQVTVSIQFDNNQTNKPKSRFLKPVNEILQNDYSQRQSVQNSNFIAPTQKQLNLSQFSDMQNTNAAPKMKSDIYAVQSQRPSRQNFVNEKIDISYREKLAEIAQSDKKQEGQEIRQSPYQISIFYMLNDQYQKDQESQQSIWILDNLQEVVGNQNMLAHKENEIGQFGNIENRALFKLSLDYTPHRVILQGIKPIRKLPLILILQAESEENYKIIIQKLLEKVNQILNNQKVHSQLYEQLSKELSKYSVLAQIKQIIEKSYFKNYDKLSNLQFQMSENANSINEVILMTEGYNQTYPELQLPKMLDFIKGLITQKNLNQDQILQAIYYSYLIMCKCQEISEEQQFQCQQFVVSFNNGADSINLLYEFITCKIKKLQNKLQIAINKLNLIILPFQSMRKQNEIILQEIYNYIFKIKQKKEFILKELISELFTKEQLEMLDMEYILTNYNQFRNQIIKNPNKFNYELIKKKPIFIFQEYKLLFQAQYRLEDFYYQINILENMYDMCLQIPNYESILIVIMEKRLNLRIQSLDMEEQEQFRETIVKLKTDMDQLMKYQNYFSNIYSNLPFALQRMKDWINTEVQQSLNLLRIINSKLHSIDVLANQIDDPRGLILIQQGEDLVNSIQQLIDFEIPPSYFDGKQLKVSADLEKAVMEISTKYLNIEQSSTQPQQQQQISVSQSQINYNSQQAISLNTQMDKFNQVLQSLSNGRDSILIKRATQQKISNLYTKLTDLIVQYQVWEHMNATRYLMGHQLLCEIINKIHQDIHDKFHIQSMLIKMKMQQSYFEMNKQISSSLSFNNHLRDGITLLTYYSDNYEEYKKVAEKNVKSPGCVTIDPLIQLIQNNVTNFFKVKTCTLLQYKDSYMKSLSNYILETKTQFEDSSKAAELDNKFEQAVVIEGECQELLNGGTQKIDDIYNLGVEAVKSDANKQKKQMTLEAYRLNLGFDAQIIQLKAKAKQAYDEFMQYKEKLQLTSLPIYKQQLDQKLKDFESLNITIIVFEKSLDAVYYNCLELINTLSEVQLKIDNMLTLGNSQFIIDSLESYERKQKELQIEIKNTYKGQKLHPSVEPMVSMTVELQQIIVDNLALVRQIINNFCEIYNIFQKFDHLINLLSEEFFNGVYRWLTFFQSKKSDRNLIYSDAYSLCEQNVKKLDKYPLIKLPFFKLTDGLNKIIHQYETEFNPDFMKVLSDFGQQYHTPGNKVQNFSEFQNELKFLLTPDNNKEAVRNALTQFYEKNKQAEVPLSRMTQFKNSVYTIQKDDRMKSQKRLKRLQNIEEILSLMGSGQMDNWMQSCKNMTAALDVYFKHVNSDQKLQPFINYVDKIEESSRSLSNVELKSFINKFIEMLKLDYNLTRF